MDAAEIAALNDGWPSIEVGSYKRLLEGRTPRKGEATLIGVMSEHCSQRRE